MTGFRYMLSSEEDAQLIQWNKNRFDPREERYADLFLYKYNVILLLFMKLLLWACDRFIIKYPCIKEVLISFNVPIQQVMLQRQLTVLLPCVKFNWFNESTWLANKAGYERMKEESCHVNCCWWSSMISEVQSQCKRLPHASFCWQALEVLISCPTKGTKAI